MRLGLSFVSLLLAATSVQAGSLQIELGGNFYENVGPAFEILADGAVIGTGSVEDSAGQVFEFSVPDDVTDIRIRYTNDQAAPLGPDGTRPADSDRDLIIRSVDINGRKIAGNELVGDGSRKRGDELVIFRNAEVTLDAPAATVAKAPEGGSAEVASGACDLQVPISNYLNGAVQLSADQQETLAPVLDLIACSITVTGYSSTSGNASANERIALERAQGVLDYLVDQGANFSSQEVVSAGETDQFGPAQADNRRVVVQLR